MTNPVSFPNTPQALAEAVAAAMWARDQATQGLDMRLLAIKPGYALLQMTVQARMLNGHHTCHGGYLFTLADSAFAFACNSYNHNTVGSACQIDYLAPALGGDVLEAEAIERALGGRTGVYDVTVRIAGGKTIALFRGKSHRMSGEIVPADGKS